MVRVPLQECRISKAENGSLCIFPILRHSSPLDSVTHSASLHEPSVSFANLRLEIWDLSMNENILEANGLNVRNVSSDREGNSRRRFTNL